MEKREYITEFVGHVFIKSLLFELFTAKFRRDYKYNTNEEKRSCSLEIVLMIVFRDFSRISLRRVVLFKAPVLDLSRFRLLIDHRTRQHKKNTIKINTGYIKLEKSSKQQ